MDWGELEAWLTARPAIRWQARAPLAAYTSWRLGGPARLLIWPDDPDTCRQLVDYCRRQGYPVLFLGRGTNLLVADTGVEAAVLHTGSLTDVEWDGDTVRAAAGLPLARLAEAAGERGLTGLEFAGGIPGSLGGALVMNAGAYGGQMSDLTRSVRALDPAGRLHDLTGPELGYGYRASRLRGQGWLVLSGSLTLRPGDRAEIQARTAAYLARRREKQPLELPSGGSVFRNPTGEGAGRFIERAGLKGRRLGQMQVSPKHANFIVNLGGGTAAAAKALIEEIQAEVARRFQVELEREVVFWGFDP
ncbi:MAG: UDP-N-acetylmuramate dehydrogenase [Peptococcaceae bacterium]|jgi:UDP-N-acetylmuramate dehydrogenase|nr:UDP-N-acetylmuramate dehydrogenase [Peptococcaceae bacterium]